MVYRKITSLAVVTGTQCSNCSCSDPDLLPVTLAADVAPYKRTGQCPAPRRLVHCRPLPPNGMPREADMQQRLHLPSIACAHETKNDGQQKR
jgi:hypothetical protein